MSDDIFCKIINKEIPTEFVYENDEVVAFRDINPKAPVHILIVPKKHIESVADLQEEDAHLVLKLILTAKKYIKNFDEVFPKVLKSQSTNSGLTLV